MGLLLQTLKQNRNAEMKTLTTKKFSFTTKRGNDVDVFSTNAVRSNGTFQCRAESVRTFAKVCGVEVECERGAAFTAPSFVEKAGF